MVIASEASEMRNRTLTILALSAVTGLAASAVTPADAGWRDRGYNGVEEGYVVANSRFGNGSVRGAVREGREGLQVQLPGGTWEYCRASCSETLRVSTVDQFENQGQMIGYGTAPLECGIFGCLDLGTRWRE
jgi:hypothetical protein